MFSKYEGLADITLLSRNMLGKSMKIAPSIVISLTLIPVLSGQFGACAQLCESSLLCKVKIYLVKFGSQSSHLLGKGLSILYIICSFCGCLIAFACL